MQGNPSSESTNFLSLFMTENSLFFVCFFFFGNNHLLIPYKKNHNIYIQTRNVSTIFILQRNGVIPMFAKTLGQLQKVPEQAKNAYPSAFFTRHFKQPCSDGQYRSWRFSDLVPALFPCVGTVQPTILRPVQVDFKTYTSTF